MIKVSSFLLPSGFEYPVAYMFDNAYYSYIGNVYGSQTLFNNGISVVNIYDGTYILPIMIYFDNNIGKWRLVNRKCGYFDYELVNNSILTQQQIQFRDSILNDLMKYAVLLLKQVPLYHISQFVDNDIVLDDAIIPQYQPNEIENFIQYCIQLGFCNSELMLLQQILLTDDKVSEFLLSLYNIQQSQVQEQSIDVVSFDQKKQHEDTIKQSDILEENEKSVQNVVEYGAEIQQQLNPDQIINQDVQSQVYQDIDVNDEQNINNEQEIVKEISNTSNKQQLVEEEQLIQSELVSEIQKNLEEVSISEQVDSINNKEQYKTNTGIDLQDIKENVISDDITLLDLLNFTSIKMYCFDNFNPKLFEFMSDELTPLEKTVILNYIGNEEYYILSNAELETWGVYSDVDYEHITEDLFVKAVMRVCNLIDMGNLSYLGSMPGLESLIFNNLRQLFLRPNTVFQSYTQNEYDENVLNLFRNMSNILTSITQRSFPRLIWVLMHIRITPTESFKYDGLLFNIYILRIVTLLAKCYKLAVDAWTIHPDKDDIVIYNYIKDNLSSLDKYQFEQSVDMEMLNMYMYAMTGDNVNEDEYPDKEMDGDSQLKTQLLDSIKYGYNILVNYLFFGTSVKSTLKDDILRINGGDCRTICSLISKNCTKEGIKPIKIESKDDFEIVQVFNMNGMLAHMGEFAYMLSYRQSLLSIDVLSSICYNYNSILVSFDMTDAVTISSMWSAFEPMLKRILFGLGTNLDDNDYLWSNKWLVDVVNVDVSNTFLKMLSVDTLKYIYCFLNNQSMNDMDLLDELDSYSLEDLRNEIWLKYGKNGELSPNCMVYYLLNSDITFIMQIIENEPVDIANIFKNSYSLYSDTVKYNDNLSNNVDKMRQAYLEYTKHLYYYISNDEEYDEIPSILDTDDTVVAEYYSKIRNSFKEVKYSYEHILKTEKNTQLKLFKNNVYNNALHTLKSGLDYRKYDNFTEITVIENNMKYYFKHMLVANAIALNGNRIQEVLGLLCSNNESNNSDLYFIPVCGKSIWNTIYKYNIDLGINDYLDEALAILSNDAGKRRMFFDNFSIGNTKFQKQIQMILGDVEKEVNIINKMIAQIKDGVTSASGNVVAGINSEYDVLVSDGVNAQLNGSNIELVRCVNKLLIAKLLKFCISLYPLRGDNIVFTNDTSISTCINLNFSEAGVTPEGERYYKLSGVGNNPLDGITFTNIMNYTRNNMNIISMNSSYNTSERYNITMPKWVVSSDTTDKDEKNIMSNDLDEKECIQYYWKIKFKGMVNN